MNTYTIYYEPADSDTEREHLGLWYAHTMSEALEKAAEYYEYPSHDLVAILDEEPAEMYLCKYCNQYHPIGAKDFYCPLDPNKPKPK